jgi:hypothetical protein
MRALQALAVLTACGCVTALGAPGPKDAKPAATVDGLLDGKPVEVDPAAAGLGADAAVKVVAGSGVTDYLDDRARPIGKDFWDQWVTRGIENRRAHVRVRFAKPREIQGIVNQQKAKFTVSEVVLLDPGEKGPVALLARDGDRYYFANQIGGHEDLAKWLAQLRGR